MYPAAPVKLLWHAAPTFGPVDDDYAAAVLRALADERLVAPVGVVACGRPAAERAEQAAQTLWALGLHHHGDPVPVGIGADAGDGSDALAPGAPSRLALPALPAGELHRQVLDDADDHSLTVLVTAGPSDLADLTERPDAPSKLRAVVVLLDDGWTGCTWEPPRPPRDLPGRDRVIRTWARLRSPAWRHVQVTLVSRSATRAAGPLDVDLLDRLAVHGEVAAWFRERHRISPNAQACLAPSVALLAAVQPSYFEPVPDGRSSNLALIGVGQHFPGVPSSMMLARRLADLVTVGLAP